MSEELRKEFRGDGDIRKPLNNARKLKNYESFDGMNFEQVRQPFDPDYLKRRQPQDGRNTNARPDEG